jgi:1-acyl-sn-glycerol-3-phosphate acyltransferase
LAALPRQARSALFSVFFVVCTVAFGLAGLPVRLFARERALALAQAWVRTLLAGARLLCGIRVEVTGWRYLPAHGPALIASQHQSAFDTLVWMTLLRRPGYVMKRELLGIPLFGPLLRPAGMIPVDRGAGALALRGLLRDCALARDDGRQVVIFPEGTRVPPGGRVPLQVGIVAVARHLGLPVLPVATDSGQRWPRGPLGKSAGIIHIAIGPPIAPDIPRPALLAKIEAHWREMERRCFVPVDKSVEEDAVDRSAGRREAG